MIGSQPDLPGAGSPGDHRPRGRLTATARRSVPLAIPRERSATDLGFLVGDDPERKVIPSRRLRFRHEPEASGGGSALQCRARRPEHEEGLRAEEASSPGSLGGWSVRSGSAEGCLPKNRREGRSREAMLLKGASVERSTEVGAAAREHGGAAQEHVILERHVKTGSGVGHLPQRISSGPAEEPERQVFSTGSERVAHRSR